MDSSALPPAEHYASSFFHAFTNTQTVGQSLSATLKSALSSTGAGSSHHRAGYYGQEFCIVVEKSWFQRIVGSGLFEHWSSVAIVTNAIWLGYVIDHVGEFSTSTAIYIQLVEHGYCFWFTLEIIFRILACNHWTDIYRDNLLKFDLFIVFCVITDTWVLAVICAFFPYEFKKSKRALQIVQVMRVWKVCTRNKSLRALAYGMWDATPAVLTCTLFVMVVIYVHSLALVALTAGSAIGKIYFNTVFEAVYLMAINAFFPDLIKFFKQFGTVDIPVAAVYMSCIFVTTYALLNMVIGIMCRVVEETSNAETTMAARAELEIHLGQLVNKMEDFGPQKVSEMVQDENIMELLNKMGIDTVELKGNAEALFPETERHNFQDLITTLMQLRSSASATSKDVCALKEWLHREVHSSVLHQNYLLLSLHETLTASIGKTA